MHIGVAGNIGAGKTTLTEMLAKHYGWEPKFEAVSYNPYLEDYYKDIERWSFNLEVYFLKQRFIDILDIARCGHTVIQDRSIFEGVYIFVANNYAQGNLSKRDFETIMCLFEQMMELVKVPDLMIYLRASLPHLIGNIQKRGRELESSIRLDYLTNLNLRYEQWADQYEGKMLVVDTDELDFVERREDLGRVIEKIDAEFNSLFAAQQQKENKEEQE